MFSSGRTLNFPLARAVIRAAFTDTRDNICVKCTCSFLCVCECERELLYALINGIVIITTPISIRIAKNLTLYKRAQTQLFYRFSLCYFVNVSLNFFRITSILFTFTIIKSKVFIREEFKMFHLKDAHTYTSVDIFKFL